jgi:hypothetical protein
MDKIRVIITIFLYAALINMMVAVVMMAITLRNKPYTPTIYSQQDNSIEIEQRLELCPENVLYWCKVFEIKFDTIVVAQSIQECGWNYESENAQIGNNIFGLQHTSEDSFEYSHWIGSLLRYKEMQDTYYKGGDYYKFLESHGYAKDPLYTNKLKQIVKMLNERL